MSALPFIDRPPTPDEYALLRLGLSTFQDGTGWERIASGLTVPGWRQIERVVAEVVEGEAQEDKGVFDVTLRDHDARRAAGLSVKSKELSRAGALQDLATNGRLYLETANSPALFWADLAEAAHVEMDFRAGHHAEAVGQCVLGTVRKWHLAAKAKFELANPGWQFDLDKSVFLVLSSKTTPAARYYQWHVLPLTFPGQIEWAYRGTAGRHKSLLGRDIATDGGVVIDWYPFSGGQLKYYPRAAGLMCSDVFELTAIPQRASILDRAKAYWPELFPG